MRDLNTSLIANKTIKRYPQGQARYIQNLLSRNWYQVKNSEAIFAIGKFLDEKRVSGGTGWAVQMGIDNKKPVFFFDQPRGEWNVYSNDNQRFLTIEYIPKLTENFAGVGTRELDDNGIKAIQEILKHNFKSM